MRTISAVEANKQTKEFNYYIKYLWDCINQSINQGRFYCITNANNDILEYHNITLDDVIKYFSSYGYLVKIDELKQLRISWEDKND
jgi:hypothetical protein